jgi:hypothetical protein
MYWVGHRDLFALIRRTDRGLVWLNILFLLPLCLLPFGAGLLGRYDQEPVALRIYGLLLVVIAVMRVVIWLYATNRPHLLWRRLDDRQRRAGLAVGLLPGLVYLVAFLVARAAPSRAPPAPTSRRSSPNLFRGGEAILFAEGSGYVYEPRHPVGKSLGHHTGVGTGELRHPLVEHRGPSHLPTLRWRSDRGHTECLPP